MRPMRLVLLLVLTIGGAAIAGGSSDEAALLAFKAGISDGGISSALASWNSSTSFCRWEGVSCGNQMPTRVVALSLPSSNLAGELSPAIGNLTFLQRLNLSSNKLHGEIPPNIGRLQRLQILDLGDNSFSGAIPVNLSSCISLTNLLLAYNQLGGRIPMELGNKLTHLQKLHLRNNSFTGEIPASLANLSSLQSLKMDDNQLEGQIPAGLGNIAALRYLSFQDNRLSGRFPASLWNLSTLTVLAASRNKLQGSIPANIGYKFPDMQQFALEKNMFTGVIPSSLFNLSSLTTLLLDNNRFSGFVPPTVGSLQSLVFLYLGDNQLEANDRNGWEFVTSLTNCSQLQYLDIADNSFSGQLPSSITNLSTTLQRLYLGENNITGNIPEDIGNLIGLKILYLGFTSLSGELPTSIGRLANLVDIGLYKTSLSGLIPSSVGNLTNLNRLYAYYTSLEGPIPASLGKLKKLFVLDLSTNRHNGSIPKEIFKLTSLSWYLDLSYNSLSGPLPTEVGTLANLNRLTLSGNQLSGQIPQSLTTLKGLGILNLTMNKLSGRIPDTIGMIGDLQQLCLAHNNFSGPIPATIQNLTMLWELDVSFNNLQGEVPDEGAFKNITYASVEGNDKLCGGIPQLHLATCPILDVRRNRKWWSKSLKIALPTAGSILLSVSATVIILLLRRKLKQGENSQVTSPGIEERYDRVSYYALSRGSNGFSEANLLGRGSYGSVYRCTLGDECAIVAVKVFNLQQSGSAKSFKAESEALRRVRHRCLIKIITCCSTIDPQGQEFKALIFEFMPNGSLDAWIHPTSSESTPSNTLSLSQRLCIAVDILDALDYLHNHCQPPIIHCDLKPSNILLAEDNTAKVGDFGISRILPKSAIETLQNSNSTVSMRGSIGYIAPEYGEGSAVSRLGDIYSLGILLLEMFTGRRPTDDMFKDSMDLHKFATAAFPDRVLDIADKKIWLHEEANDKDAGVTSTIEQCLASVIKLSISCSMQQAKERMVLADAVSEMHTIRDEYLRSRMVKK